jgi:hypothetical protein
MLYNVRSFSGSECMPMSGKLPSESESPTAMGIGDFCQTHESFSATVVSNTECHQNTYWCLQQFNRVRTQQCMAAQMSSVLIHISSKLLGYE